MLEKLTLHEKMIFQVHNAATMHVITFFTFVETKCKSFQTAHGLEICELWKGMIDAHYLQQACTGSNPNHVTHDSC